MSQRIFNRRVRSYVKHIIIKTCVYNTKCRFIILEIRLTNDLSLIDLKEGVDMKLKVEYIKF